MVKIIHYILLSLSLLLLGCQGVKGNHAEAEDEQQEYIFEKLNNYRGLIKIYRDRLNRRENAEDRYKLAEYYYLVEDYTSSRLYLRPLLISHPDENVLLLEGKNLFELGRNDEALTVVNRVLQQNQNSGDAWNIQGILLAQKGQFDNALQAFEEARMRFVDEETVINNLAMLAIIKEDYIAARDYLWPMYMRGQTSPRMLHNLVFTLVKLQDFSSAEDILTKQKMVDNIDGLLESLVQVKPRPQTELQKQILPVQIAEIKDKEIKPSVLLENNLPVTSAPQSIVVSKDKKMQKIIAVRTGQHDNYFRMTLESSHSINFREVVGTEKNKQIFELSNVMLTNSILAAAETIPSRHRNIRNLRFYQKDSITVVIELEFDRPVIKNNIFRLTENKSKRERLVFDIYL